MVVVVAKFGKRLVEVETLAKASESECVPPLPLLPAHFPHAPTAPPAVGMPVGVSLHKQADSDTEIVRPQ